MVCLSLFCEGTLQSAQLLRERAGTPHCVSLPDPTCLTKALPLNRKIAEAGTHTPVLGGAAVCFSYLRVYVFSPFPKLSSLINNPLFESVLFFPPMSYCGYSKILLGGISEKMGSSYSWHFLCQFRDLSLSGRGYFGRG